MGKRFFCLWCKGSFESEQDIMAHTHPCDPMFKMMNGTITVELSETIKMKRTRWGRFMDKIFSWDISFGLAFMGLVIVNAIVMTKLGLNFKLSLVEGLAFGFAIPRLLK